MIRLKIRNIAENKGFNQSSLSREAGVNFNTIKRIYRDPHHNISAEVLGKIAKALQVEPGELMEIVDDPPPPER